VGEERRRADELPSQNNTLTCLGHEGIPHWVVIIEIGKLSAFKSISKREWYYKVIEDYKGMENADPWGRRDELVST
jgi:hypothetical protein